MLSQYREATSPSLSQPSHSPFIPPSIATERHYAHILSCVAEYRIQPPALGIAWDSAGYGPSQTIWGGDFLQITPDSANGLKRVAHFLPYYLPGGDICSLEPRRSALGLLYSCYGEAAFEMIDLPPMQTFKKHQLIALRKMLTQKVNTAVTSSVSRLFDGVAALLNLHQYVSFEGQAALTLEFAATQSPVKSVYPITLSETQPILVDWRPMVRAIVEDYRNAVMTPVIAAKFQNTLVSIIGAIAQTTAVPQVIMAGDCFQNAALVGQAIVQLSEEGFIPYWPQRVVSQGSRSQSSHFAAAQTSLHRSA
jgi:hydrogenase maturation protein HypF